jgi:hypothetical protein
VTLETASLGVQIGGEQIDIVVLSLDKQLRSKLLSDRFTLGSDASAAWETASPYTVIRTQSFCFSARPREHSQASAWMAQP